MSIGGLRFKQDSGRLPPCARAAARPASSSSASRRSSGVVTLRFSSLARTTITFPPSRSISQASSVACASTSGDVQRALERLATEYLRRLHRPQLAAIERLAHGAGAVHALDRVRDRHARRSPRRRPGRAPARRSPPQPARPSPAGARRRGRARGHRRPRGRRRARARGARSPSARPRRPRGTRSTARRRPLGAGRHGDDDPLDAGRRQQRVDAPLRAAGGPASSTSAFGPPAPRRSPLPAATISATVIAGALAHAALALPRARKPRYLAPAAAIWWLAESSSSSSR